MTDAPPPDSIEGLFARYGLAYRWLVTATVMTGRDEENRLEKASRAVEGAAGAASVDLRVCYGAQDTGFAAGLPFGIDLAAYRPPSLMGSLG